MQEDNQFNSVNFSNDTINVREELEKYAYHWKWFVLGIALSLAGAFTYLRYTQNEYAVATTILIDDENSGGLPSELSAFEDLGLLGSGKNR